MERPDKCPNCGSKIIAKIEYGFQSYSEKLDRDIKEGRISLGGCVQEVLGPDYECFNCKREVRSIGNFEYSMQEIIRECALQFNGMRYEFNKKIDVTNLVEQFKSTSRFFEDVNDNFAVFYWYLNHIESKGWDAFPEYHQDIINVVRLFVYLYDKSYPDKYKNRYVYRPDKNRPNEFKINNRNNWERIYKSQFFLEILVEIKIKYRDHF